MSAFRPQVPIVGTMALLAAGAARRIPALTFSTRCER
jgi:hypothetical protein